MSPPAVQTSSKKLEESKAQRVLLSEDVEPSAYTISLEPDLDKYTYTGEETISIEVVNETDVITVHSRDVAVQEAEFTSLSEGSEPIAAAELSYNLKMMTLAFKFPSKLPVGTATLRIVFSGTLNDQMAGFYRSEYKSVEGEKRIMASTQFEALDARRCFPCWDEPARKATFELTLVRKFTTAACSQLMHLSRLC